MAEQSQQQAPTPSKQKKTIFDVGYGSIFMRNFLAGFARALGAIFVYLILGGLIYYLSVTYIIPQISRFIPTSIPLFGPSLQPPTSPGEPGNGYTVTPEQLEGALEYLQQGQKPPPQQPSP